MTLALTGAKGGERLAAPPFGPALNLAEQARGRGIRCVRITAKAATAA